MILIDAQVNGLPGVALTEVPRDVNVANQVDFINLNDSAECWANHIVHLDM